MKHLPIIVAVLALAALAFVLFRRASPAAAPPATNTAPSGGGGAVRTGAGYVSSATTWLSSLDPTGLGSASDKYTKQFISTIWPW